MFSTTPDSTDPIVAEYMTIIRKRVLGHRCSESKASHSGSMSPLTSLKTPALYK